MIAALALLYVGGCLLGYGGLALYRRHLWGIPLIAAGAALMRLGWVL